MPESPLYLLRRERPPRRRPSSIGSSLSTARRSLGADASFVPSPVAQSAGIFSVDLRKRSLMILAIWFWSPISYYPRRLYLDASALAGEGFGFVRGYGFLVVLALAQIPATRWPPYGVEKWGEDYPDRLLPPLGTCCLLFVIAALQR